MSPILLAAALAGLAGPGQARIVDDGRLPSVVERRIDSAIGHVLSADGTPSASVAVVLKGRLVYAKAFGLASISPRRAATGDTRYQLASASKSITAQTLLILAAEGRLSLDAPVARWLPEVTNAGQITVRELLEHASGLPDHYPQSYPAGPRGGATTPARIIAQWGSHPLLFKPGAQFRYSNLNYVAAGRIAELISGEPLFALQQRRVFAPLGMTHVVDLDHVTGGTPQVATGYVWVALAPLEPAATEGAGWSFGAGQIVTTAEDLARWDIGLLTERILPARLIREETTAPTLADSGRSPYALGLFVSDRSGRLTWSHVGQGLGFLAGNTIFPAEGAAIVVLTNTSATASFADITDRIEYILLPPIAVDARVRALIAGLQGGRLDRTALTPEFSAYLHMRRLRAFRASLAPLGGLAGLALVSTDVADGVTTRRYDAVAGGRHLRVVWEETADGKTDDLTVQAAAG